MSFFPPENGFTRRDFLKAMSWAPAALMAAPFSPFRQRSVALRPFADAEFRLSPTYPAKSPLDDVLRLVQPGLDEFITEKYAFEIMQVLVVWSDALTGGAPALHAANFLAGTVQACSLRPVQEKTLRSDALIEVVRRSFSPELTSGGERFRDELTRYFSGYVRVETAEFQIVRIEDPSSSSGPVQVDIRYDLVGSGKNGIREERIGLWRTQWLRSDSGKWSAVRWEATEELVSRVRGPAFAEVTLAALGATDSYKKQLLHGADYWRTVLDGATGIDVYGNNGLAVGDIDNDGFDDLYVCQPPGLPNRLYRNRGDGTLEDITDKSGVGLLEGTACALFADFENKGAQDLLVVCATGPQLFVNQGSGKFQRKRDAFKFAQSPQGTFTHAAAADYDGDGKLDIYFCLYSYYLGLDQYHYPAPYFDARNGPPNFLMHNDGDGRFSDRTEAAGLNAENDRYSFACAWGDFTGDGRPSLYVANDFGRNNLYRNNGDEIFTAISDEAHVNDVGAGMSATWLDYDNDGRQDVYVSNMWSAAGLRVSEQPVFHERESEEVHALYRQHARGNSLYRNLGNGQFKNVSSESGVDMGRWAWCSDAWDFDHDGYPDLYIANGYVSGSGRGDLGSFFWRQVVGKSPSTARPSPNYEHGWNAINELIRSDSSWNGYERNVLYVSNHDGTFSEVSGVLGLDFSEDSRSFVLCDLDHDGRLELILKNRNAPQIRILRCAARGIGHSIVFRLKGKTSSRDAIGTAVTVEAAGNRQTKYLQAGSGFLAQHTKEILFGVGEAQRGIRATVRWPGGSTQRFENLPVNHRIEIEEGSASIRVQPFSATPAGWMHDENDSEPEKLPDNVETWLIEPLIAPAFSLADTNGDVRELQSFRGSFVLLACWNAAAPDSIVQLRELQQRWPDLKRSGIEVVAMNLDLGVDSTTPRETFASQRFSFPILLATDDVAGIYNILFRYLFDRRRDLPIPASFLIDPSGMIIKVYQGVVAPSEVVDDVRSRPNSEAERLQRALPFAGILPEDGFQRNDFTYGIALFHRGYMEQAAESFRQVIAAQPNSSEAYYNLGTLCLRTKKLREAQGYLEQAVQLQPDYAEAWNNLGTIAAEQGRSDEAVANFQHSLSLKPGYAVALVNLGNLYRHRGDYDQAAKFLSQALEIEPNDPEANYSAGMLYARQSDYDRASHYLEAAVTLRPEYAEARNNLGVLLVQVHRYSEAEDEFKSCIRVAPSFEDAYLNLARLYVLLRDSAKARDVLEGLLRQQPGNKTAQQALDMLH
jgi:Flp pilus assembly protein TadD/peroxiredoxin